MCVCLCFCTAIYALLRHSFLRCESSSGWRKQLPRHCCHPVQRKAPKEGLLVRTWLDRLGRAVLRLHRC